MSNSPKKISVKFRFWINSDGEKLFGKGRIELLQLIEKHGSILKASQEMKMSYRQAWQMVKELNERSNKPLVEKYLGGKTGGGARLTSDGHEAIKNYLNFSALIENFISENIHLLQK